MKKILMCPPNYYNVEYEINPWMDTKNKVDTTNALNVYRSLKEIYEKLGLTVWEIEPVKGLPDMVYTANVGYVEGNTFIKSNFKFDQRKKESKLAADFLKKKNYEIKTIPDEIIFEGEGDVIRSDNKYFLGWGKRTMPEAKEYLEKYTGKEFTLLELVDPFYYHLDTCFAPLSDEVVVINPASFTAEGLETIKKSFSSIIETNEKDNQVLACNFVTANNCVVIGKGISDELEKNIKDAGFEIRQIDMSEYMKGGGSVKCVTLEIYD